MPQTMNHPLSPSERDRALGHHQDGPLRCLHCGERLPTGQCEAAECVKAELKRGRKRVRKGA